MRGWRSWTRRSTAPRRRAESPRAAVVERNPHAVPAVGTAATTGEVSCLREGAAPPRPIAVWLLLLALSAFTAVLAFGSAFLLWDVLSRWGEGHRGWLMALSIAAISTVPAALVWTCFALCSRRRWSRWVGAVMILAYAAFSMLWTDTAQYDNPAQRAGGYLARTFVVPLLCAWWCYAFAFSTKARRYFTKTVADQG